MKKHLRIFVFFSLFLILAGHISAQGSGQISDQTAPQGGSIEAKSSINWITRDFITKFVLDTKKANLVMPSGKKAASAKIKSKMPQLIQPALLSLFEDSNQNLADSVIMEELTLDQVYNFIMGGYKTPDVFSDNAAHLQTTNKLAMNKLSSQLVRHEYAYNPIPPLEDTPSRPFSGIIIDARGKMPVHGEYVSSDTYPCLFPTIWDDQMNKIYEKNIVTPQKVMTEGLTAFNYDEESKEVEARVGTDPLYIRAIQVYGRNRTDPIIKKSDALKILSVPENIKLLQEGKVAILLDKENLIYDIATPEKTQSYYVRFNEIKRYFYENKVPNIDVSDSINGILFSVDLKFYPDSPELLPSEKERIDAIASSLKNLLMDDGYTILVEGHTADVGKPVGQLNLSIERTRTVMKALVADGIDESLFTYKGYGGTMPIATNETEEGRAQNRRVDITARPRATYIQRDWN